MSWRQFEILASAAQTTSGQSASQPIPTLTMADVVITVSDSTGTLTTVDMWLEGSADNSTWYEIPVDSALEGKGAATAGTVAIDQRNIVSDTTPNTTQSYMGHYRHLAAGYVRLAYNVAGGGSVTFSARLTGK